MESTKRDFQQKNGELEELVGLYEDGFEEIQAILGDGDLTAGEQLDSIAEIVFDDQVEGD